MRNICEGKQSCIINPANSVFGNPCPGTEKYVHVDYHCMKRKYKVTVEVVCYEPSRDKQRSS